MANRVRQGRVRVVAEAERARERLEAARPRSAAIDSIWRAFEHDTATGGPVLAGAVAFRIFLFLIPYVFVIVVSLGFTIGEGTSAQDLARKAGIGGLTASAVQGTEDMTTARRVFAVVLGTVALLWATRTALKVLRVVHALIWGMRPVRAPMVRPVLITLALVTVSTASGIVTSRLAERSFLLAAAAMAASVVIPAGLWLLASLHFPHADAPWTALLPGAFVVGVGVELLHFVTLFWIARSVSSKADLYGTIGAALALLLWAYLLGRLVTLGAVVNAALWRRRAPLGGEGLAAG